jgi:hypothetical protein
MRCCVLIETSSPQVLIVGVVLTGFVGYSAYAASKYAVRGLAECLRNEASISLSPMQQHVVLALKNIALQHIVEIGNRTSAYDEECSLSFASHSISLGMSFAAVLRPVFSVLQLKGTGVRLSVAFPADVDTPGYKQENLTKVH